MSRDNKNKYLTLSFSKYKIRYTRQQTTAAEKMNTIVPPIFAIVLIPLRASA